MTQNNRFLGGAAPRTITRTLMEVTSLRAVMSEQGRAFLAQNKRIKLQTSAQKGIEVKYDLLNNVNLTDMDTLKAVYRMSIRIEEPKEDMAKYDIHIVLCLYPVNLQKMPMEKCIPFLVPMRSTYSLLLWM